MDELKTAPESKVAGPHLTRVLAMLARSFRCPECGSAQMAYVRTIPRLGTLPELFVFRCDACNFVESKEQDRAA
jgi:DNA-directed RNA polymerase subunit M/transcription elongation factor TFIIS